MADPKPTSKMLPVPLRQPSASDEAPVPVYDHDGSLTGYVVGRQFLPVPRSSERMPALPTADAVDTLLDHARNVVSAAQRARADAHVAIDIDYRDQIFGGVRSSWNKFQANGEHNRLRGELVQSVNLGLQQVMQRGVMATTAALDTYAAEQQLVLQERLQEHQLTMRGRAWQQEEQLGPEAQAHRRTVELLHLEQAHEVGMKRLDVDAAAQSQRSDQEHEVLLTVLSAGQQLPDLLAQMQRLQASDPAAVTATLMSALQLAMTQYQQIVATADPAARKQLANQFQPLLGQVLQQALGTLRSTGSGGPK